ncbi:uncharacterized protein [Primulina eburnea]|uniref:uncharacterized protein n=1 Tax=Primulina eburnea TaxID=1245227 RepID=UPI003C6CA661
MKSENGYKAGYLNFLENSMRATLPETNLRGNPHINSKIHVWKKTHGILLTILSKSGVGWNDTDKTIEATDKTWEAIIKADPRARPMRSKQWDHYHDWCEIFGNDRATGKQADNNAIVESINELADIITQDTMKDLIKQLASKEKIANADEKVLDTLQGIPELVEDEKVHVAELLVDNHAKLSLFLRLGDKGNLSLAKRLLGGD